MFFIGINFEYFLNQNHLFMKQKSLLIYTILFSVFYSCTTVKIASNKADNYHKKLSKVFVLIETDEKASKFSNAFATKLMTALKKQNIDGRFVQKTTLSLETDKEYLQKIEKFAPKQLVTIKQTAISYKTPSILNSIIFEINIIDYKTNKIIWKGELDVYGQVGLNDTINKSLKEFLKKLKKDKLL